MATEARADLTRYDGVHTLVIGATGFIGRAVVRALARVGARVDVLVRDAAAARALRLECGAAGGDCVCDIRDAAGVNEAIGKIRPAITFNLAGYGVAPLEHDEAEAFRVNGSFVRALCEALAAGHPSGWRGRELVHVGSQLEYGRVALPAEDAEPAPDTVYGRSKLEGTRAVADAGRSSGLSAVTARLFNVYGPGEHAARLLPSLIEAAVTGAALDLTAGRQRLDFTYVDDVAEAVLRLGAGAGVPGEVVNVATGRLTSVREFAVEAARQLGIAPAQLRFGVLPARAEENAYERVPVARLIERTSWSPPTKVADGIRQTLRRATYVGTGGVA